MNKLLKLRLEHELTLQQLAEKTGIKRETLSRAENGRLMMPMTLAKLAKAFDIPIEELIELKANRGGGRPRKNLDDKIEQSEEEIKSEELINQK